MGKNSQEATSFNVVPVKPSTLAMDLFLIEKTAPRVCKDITSLSEPQ
jgi:hypothetical protein